MLTGQRILVTGFTGRLGGAFAAYLAADNEVTGVALAATDEELASRPVTDEELLNWWQFLVQAGLDSVAGSRSWSSAAVQG